MSARHLPFYAAAASSAADPHDSPKDVVNVSRLRLALGRQALTDSGRKLERARDALVVSRRHLGPWLLTSRGGLGLLIG
jgi:hypothetical protein